MSYTGKVIDVGFESLQEDGLRDTAVRASYFGYTSVLKAMYQLTGKTHEGEPVYNQDWDALIVLDACRPDLMDGVKDEYSFVDEDFDTFYSWAGASDEWMRRNFSDAYTEEKQNTLMITGNGFSDDYLNGEDFLHMEEAWRYAHDTDKGAIMPGPITDAAIDLSRQFDEDRLIVHYMQPHYPFLDRPEIGTDVDPETWGENAGKDPWDKILLGETTRDEVWPLYRENLRTVMDEVEILLDNLDAEKTVITADHGNALGRLTREELGIHGHERKIAVNALREVPWVETSAEDNKTYEPERDTEETDSDQEQILRDLGYLQ